ncbi:hypothetical protein DMN91_005240 [Ooceraea biroi]|uniref:Uncharacterized protein n=1 Tax=Ooceraea biroi TaxID=2015173 RepID=A0A3L8DRN1_OOCBI|nr:hypothetical protein DMN91_005240 [Ooceraea biroi]
MEERRERTPRYPVRSLAAPRLRRRPMESRVRGGAFRVGQHGSSASLSPAGGHSAEEDPLRTSLVDTPVSAYCSSASARCRGRRHGALASLSHLAAKRPEISRCSDPRNSRTGHRRILSAAALLSVSVRHGDAARSADCTSPDVSPLLERRCCHDKCLMFAPNSLLVL